MKKLFFTALLFTSLITTAKAQQAAKSIYFELGGPGFASFNYDTRFSKKEDGLGARVGVSYFNIDGDGLGFFPFGLNYLLGKDNRNYFEIGAGATILTAKEEIFNNNKNTSTFGYLQFGYRLQPKKGGFLFRADITPVFGNGFFIPYYAGISLGYKF